MAGKTIIMSKIKQLLLMHQQGCSNREIAKNLSIDKGTVNAYIQKLKLNNFDLSFLLNLDDPLLSSHFHSGSPAYCSPQYEVFKSLLPHFESELKRKHVTRILLWEEYISSHPDGYRYSQFCYHLNQLLEPRSSTAVLAHRPCQELYVDFAGDTLFYVDRLNGECHKVQVFVACMPYSGYTFVIAVNSQRTEDFLYALECCLNHLKGSPPILVTDNLKSAVIKSHRYEPELNRVLEDFANHYGMSVRPTRPYKPRDKAQVEGHVRIIYNRVYAKLRNQTFFSLKELNSALFEKTMEHNQTRMQQKAFSREEQFLSEERPLLRSLPENAFEIKHYASLRVGANNHIFLARDKHYYSVPSICIGKNVTVIYTA
jgi:transposase